MRLKFLKLKNYRNCLDVELDLTSNKILIIGKNAQGKTNILESVYLLSSLKSPRTQNALDFINFNSEICEVSSEIFKNNTDISLDFIYTTDKKRTLKANSLKTTPKEFKRVLKTVLFSSGDLMLLRGNPQERRDWLDRAISQVYPAYDERLSKYNKIRTQKNNFLKDCKDGTVDETLLDVYNEQMVISGSNIIYLRKKFLKEVERIAQEKHSTINNDENLTLSYDCDFLEDEVEIEDIAKKYTEKLQERKCVEIARLQSTYGPHRDDIKFMINGNDATKFASQGQQRTIVLALKLSELDIIKDKTGENPVLLLDDVLAELDDLRQNYLLKSINEETQTIITSVDTLLFNEEFLKDVQIYSISQGSLAH